MAPTNPPPPFRVQHLVDDVQAFAHHRSVSELWSTKWKQNCSLGLYPFVDGNIQDFEPIFEELIQRSDNKTEFLYDPDAYAAAFLPTGEALVKQAEAAEAAGATTDARDLFLRAAAVYRIARFPLVRSPLGQQAWAAGKAAYLRGGAHLNPPIAEVHIPFIHADAAAGDSTMPIPAYIRVPSGAAPPQGWPLVLFICGLDSYRTDNTDRLDAHVRAGCAVLALEIPGTGDCPAARRDAAAPDRLFGSVLEWVAGEGRARYGFDAQSVVARGISTGAYYAARLAHTHAARLRAAVAQGLWAHYALAPQWVRAMDHMEYPFALAEALAGKFGYGSVDAMLADDAQARFSLVGDGRILDRPSCRLLVVNGVNDSVFPIEDSVLVASHGRAKDVRLMEGKGHMGNPGADDLIIDWISEVLAVGTTGPKTCDA